MPCRDYPPNGSFYEDPAQRRRADKLARIACELAQYIDAHIPMKVEHSDLSVQTKAWWNEHKEADRIREEREAKARRIAQIKRQAIGKLTPEEKKALGL